MTDPRHLRVICAAALVATSIACRPAAVCTPGETQACLCPDLSMSAQSCADDGRAWGTCGCGVLPGVDGGLGPGVDGGLGPGIDGGAHDASMFDVPPGPMVACVPPGRTDVATIVEGTAFQPELQYAPGGALVSIDGVPCTYDGSTPGAQCTDHYTCGACPITIEGSTAGSRYMESSCPMYRGPYSLCELTQSCAGRSCGTDSCGRSCAPGCMPDRMCSDGACVMRRDPCAECLDACSGLPSCCTGTGCICDSACP